jgi:hypothetical protein
MAPQWNGDGIATALPRHLDAHWDNLRAVDQIALAFCRWL